MPVWRSFGKEKLVGDADGIRFLRRVPSNRNLVIQSGIAARSQSQGRRTAVKAGKDLRFGEFAVPRGSGPPVPAEDGWQPLPPALSCRRCRGIPRTTSAPEIPCGRRHCPVQGGVARQTMPVTRADRNRPAAAYSDPKHPPPPRPGPPSSGPAPAPYAGFISVADFRTGAFAPGFSPALAFNAFSSSVILSSSACSLC